MNKWTSRDFITLAIFTIVILITYMFSTILTPFVGQMIAVAITGFLITPFMFVMVSKINKIGVFFLTAILLGLFFAITGLIHYIFIYVAFSFIAELIVWKRYQSLSRLTFATIVFHLSYISGGIIPLFLFRERYLAIVETMYTKKGDLESMLYYYGTPSMATIMLIAAAIGVIVGSVLGRRLLQQHVKKAKLA